ncbi:disease resistance RPP13-like protein 4 [Magnolia sinica]|uniref:disease resistance RPP13-like protein 4 n=1 Tax=Magnolia sinica TaxID=86752 RepID=UPI0026591B5F|nr:disease resistance RPP13-like protein 4 [Magnolia sinica]
MVDAAVGVLLDKLLILLISEGRRFLELDDQFEETKNELRYMQSYLKEADRVTRKDRNEVLKMVMSDLRELVYDVEDIIEDFQLLFLKKHQGCAPNFTSCCSPTLLKSRRQMGKRLRKINQEVRKVKERMIAYVGTTPHLTGKEEGGNRPLTYPILIDEAELVGLEDDTAKIRNWILEANGLPTVIGIVGMAGIGKTTLAQKICDSVNVQESFKHSLIVSVSQSFKLDELLRKMLNKLNVEEKSLRGKDVDELLKKLKQELDEKYLIVLDDIWGTDQGMWWASLKSALPRVRGSCVIVTTRNEEVAKSMGATIRHIHHPRILSDEDSWFLFSKVAFAKNGGNCTNPDLEGLGKEIVVRCGGLPLTIKVVGGMMLGKGYSIHEWRRISKHLKEELASSMKDELVISRLELSYEELPGHLKPCLLCFAMYPEDSEIPFLNMVYRWIGEGFVWGRNGKTAFEIGEECFAELFNRCLIAVGKDTFGRRFGSCRMHDMVRDMVIKIAREESFVSLDGRVGPVFSVQSRRLGILRNTAVESIENSSKLRTLVGMNIASEKIILSVKTKLCELRWLRVLYLSLSTTKIDEDLLAKDWLSGIGSLQHLVYLYIEKTALRKLPDSIGNLRNLQILSLFDCPNLERLPSSITTLEKLTTFHIVSCDSFECMPEGLGNLSNLEQLSWFRSKNSRLKNGYQIPQLKNLTKLRELRMKINYEEQTDEGEWNVLSMLNQLQLLLVDFVGNSPSPGLVRKLDHQLSPLKCLRELWLWNFPGERTPAWLNPTSLPNLQFLTIYWGKINYLGPKFWDCSSRVWKVEVLVLGDLYDLEEEWPRMQRAMPSLRLLKVYRCPKLKSFPFDVSVEGRWRIWRKEEEEEREPMVNQV